MAGVRELNRIRHLVIVFMAAVMALTPVYATLAEMQATPIVDPPTPTADVFAPTPAADPDPSTAATPSAEKSTQTDEVVSPNAVVEGPGTSLHGCRQSSEVISPNFPIKVNCDFTLRGSGGLGDIIAIIIGRVDAPMNLPVGYSVDIKITPKFLGGGSDLLNSSGGGFAISHFGEVLLGGTITSNVEIVIKVSDAAIPRSSFTATFFSCRAAALTSTACLSGNNRQGGAVTVTGTVDEADLVPGEHFFLECKQPVPASVPFTKEAEASCEVSSKVGTRSIRLDKIVTTLNAPDAWSVTVTDANDIPLVFEAGEFSLQTPVEVGVGPYVFKMKFEPIACSAGNSQLTVGVNIGVVPLHSGEVVGPAVGLTAPIELSATFDAPATSANITRLSVIDPDPVQYSMTSDTEELYGSMTFTYTVSGCGPWNAYAKISSFTKKNHEGYVGSVPYLFKTSHVSTHAGVINEPLDNPIAATWTPLITGSDPGATPVTYDHTIEFEYTIPANTPAGTYEAEIVVSTVAAP